MSTPLCTRAITHSTHPANQPIYVCQSCPSATNDNASLCECCAEICHGTHDVIFVGVGPSTCDCGELVKCELAEESNEVAAEMGWRGGRCLNYPLSMGTIPPSIDDIDVYSEKMEEDGDESSSSCQPTLCIECNTTQTMCGYTIGSFSIPSLGHSMHSLIHQAETLVSHSKDTFWIPSQCDPSPRCGLEHLAAEIYHHHVQAYGLHRGTTNEEAGAEWWVQVKHPDSPPIDLHYDKDEALAETFCLGSFPTISTVTYLSPHTTSQQQGTEYAPTLVFPHCYNDEESQPIPAMVLSRPVGGKHIVFDGRLLHGAPNHPSLLLQDGKVSGMGPRVTLLVNVWMTRPSGVEQLSSSIRGVLESSAESTLLPLEFVRREVLQYLAPDELSLVMSGRATKPMVLPFVCKGATWIDDEEHDENCDASIEDEEELVLQVPQFVTPQLSEEGADTVLIVFPEGGEARLIRGGV